MSRGKWSVLKNVIEPAKQKRILGIGSTIYVPLSGIGGIGEPVSIASVVASATAVIALSVHLFKNATDGLTQKKQKREKH